MTNQPTHDVFYVREVAEGKSRGTTIGVAWAHRDGKGYTVHLDGLVPLDGRLHLRERKEPSKEAEPPTEDVAAGSNPFVSAGRDASRRRAGDGCHPSASVH